MGTLSSGMFPTGGSIPIGSMHGIYANIWGILMVNVTIYTLHGSYGICLESWFQNTKPIAQENDPYVHIVGMA